MTMALLVGCGLLVFSPAALLSVLVLQRQPQLVIVAVASAFVWLLSLLATSLLWGALVPLRTVWPIVLLLGVVTQEAARLLFLHGYRRTEAIIKRAAVEQHTDFPLNDVTSSIAAGTGFGVMHALMQFGTILAASDPSAGLYLDSCPRLPLVFVLALFALCFFLMDVGISVSVFASDRRGARYRTYVGPALHLGASLMTLINLEHNGCHTSLPLVVLFTAATCVWAWYELRYLVQYSTSAATATAGASAAGDQTSASGVAIGELQQQTGGSNKNNKDNHNHNHNNNNNNKVSPEATLHSAPDSSQKLVSVAAPGRSDTTTAQL